ncbi:MAG: hypothetical protein IPK19_38230 [Chloroflexi bacterium]|nr:hypothetical protein [Chloroflexota bacterium]
MKKQRTLLISLSLIALLFVGGISSALAAGETFQVISVNTTGCSSGQFGMTVERANLDGGTYYVNTVVTVGELIYMNELASISVNGLSGWNIFDNFTYGPVPNPGTYPIPAGQTMRLDFTLERPVGTALFNWTLIVDGCDTGNVLYNGPTPSGNACNLAVPSGSVVGEAPLGAQVYYAPDQLSPGVVLNPGTYVVIGQDESETYYKVVLACQTVWVRKDTMQPSYQAPQNGTPLPTGVVS